MPYLNLINETVSRKYHAYSDDVTKELQKIYDVYFRAASELEESSSAEKVILDEHKKQGLVSEIAYKYALEDIDNRYTYGRKIVDALNDKYEAAVKEVESTGYEILLTSGIVYAVLNRYQESPETDHLNVLYKSVMEAKKQFSTLLTEQYKINTDKGLDNFVQNYIREIYTEEEKGRLANFESQKAAATTKFTAATIAVSLLRNIEESKRTEAEKAEILLHEKRIEESSTEITHYQKMIVASESRIYRITPFEIDLKVDLHKANLSVALLQQKKLEDLIVRFNEAYKALSATHPEMRSPRIMQDLDGVFYADLYARDLDAELAGELAKDANNKDDNEIARLKKQIEQKALINSIDEQSRQSNSEEPPNLGLDKFGIKIEVLGEVINWFIIGPMDQSTQHYRDIIYQAAANAHSLIDGCTGYYRGTNSLHLKRHHTKVEDSFYNHNHYRFEKDVTPDMLRDHMNAIIMQQYGGNILNRDHRPIGEEAYMSMEMRKQIVDTIVSEYDAYYKIFSTERTLNSAIDMHNVDLIRQVADLFADYGKKTKEFDSVKALEEFMDVTITTPLLNNGITPDMLAAYSAALFSNMTEYSIKGSSNKYVFNFNEYLQKYAEKAHQRTNPPLGYDHYKALADQVDGDNQPRKFSQKDVYNNSSSRKLTLDDEQELKVAQAHERSCINKGLNATRGFGSFMALFRTTRTKANFTLVHTNTNTHSNLFKDKSGSGSSTSTATDTAAAAYKQTGTKHL